jgi:NADH dehydrogenase
MTDAPQVRAVIVGGGFAGVACARHLATSKDVHVTLIDRNDDHQFQPLLNQVATSMLAPGDVAFPLRKTAAEYDEFDTKRAEVVAVDPASRTVTTPRRDRYRRRPRPASRLPAELLRDPRRGERIPALFPR